MFQRLQKIVTGPQPTRAATRATSPSGRCFSRLVLLGLVLTSLTRAVCGDPTAPSAQDRQVTLTVATLLEREHLSKHPLDKQISERCLKTFLKTLDPWKLYFYQSDVDAFERHKDDLAAMAKRGDVGFPYVVFKVFLERMDERVKTADQLLEMRHDFTADEEMLLDMDKLPYCRTPAEATEKWRKRVKYDLLVLALDKTEGKEAVTKLSRRYHSAAKRWHQTDGQELLELYLNALSSAFDPHSNYMSPALLKAFEIQMSRELEGIGALLEAVDEYAVVKELVVGGVAEKDGRLKVKDKIVGVGDGDNGKLVDTIDMKVQDVVSMIRGKAGTVVRLAVVSPDGPEQKIIKLTRAKIELKDARSRIFEDGRKSDGAPYRIGVIDLPSFYMDMEGAKRGLSDFKSTTRDVQKILADFNRQRVDAVVLDLRRNGGGSLTEAIHLTGLFIGEGPVVQVKGADGHVLPQYDLDPGIDWSGPLVVLISKFSASASEILAGAIQDYGRGLIVGDRATHGKGTVQNLLDLGQSLFGIGNAAPPMGALKITVQQFYRPNGESTQKRGVLADVELPSLSSHYDIGEVDLDYPMEFDKVAAVALQRCGGVNPAVCAQLARHSQQRCSRSEEFQQELKKIERYEEEKARKSVTLNQQKFLKERAELNADKEQEKKLQELDTPSHAGIERDYYLDEVLAITVDYMSLAQVAKCN